MQQTALLHPPASRHLIAQACLVRPLKIGLVQLALSAAILTPSLTGLSQVIYDAAEQFSADTNPKGPWSYGFSSFSAETFTPFPGPPYSGRFDSSAPSSATVVQWGRNLPFPSNHPIVMKNVSQINLTTSNNANIVLQAGSLAISSGERPNPTYGTLRFTVPRKGLYTIEAVFSGIQFSGDYGGTTTDVHVLIDGRSIYDGMINGFRQTQRFDSTNPLLLNSGATIDFAVGPGANNNQSSDWTGLTVIISDIAPIEKETTFDGHTYLLIRDPQAHDIALQIAKGYRGYLAVPNGQRENDWLVEFSGKQTFWIGIHREKAGAANLTFLRDYDNKPTKWENWNRLPGQFEPNFSGGDEWYGMVYGTITPWWTSPTNRFIGLWNDQGGGVRLTVIVEIPSRIQARSTTLLTDQGRTPAMSFSFGSAKGHQYTLQATTDFRKWRDVGQVVGDSREVSLIAPIGARFEFFRLLENE